MRKEDFREMIPVGPLERTDDEIRTILVRTICERWPSEHLLFLADCLIERGLPEAHESGLEPRAGGIPPTLSPRPGVIGATQARLIHQARRDGGTWVRVLAFLLGFTAVAILLFGNGLSGFLPVASAFAALWAAGKVWDLFAAGGRYLPY